MTHCAEKARRPIIDAIATLALCAVLAGGIGALYRHSALSLQSIGTSDGSVSTLSKVDYGAHSEFVLPASQQVHSLSDFWSLITGKLTDQHYQMSCVRGPSIVLWFVTKSPVASDPIVSGSANTWIVVDDEQGHRAVNRCLSNDGWDFGDAQLTAIELPSFPRSARMLRVSFYGLSDASRKTADRIGSVTFRNPARLVSPGTEPALRSLMQTASGVNATLTEFRWLPASELKRPEFSKPAAYCDLGPLPQGVAVPNFVARFKIAASSSPNEPWKLKDVALTDADGNCNEFWQDWLQTTVIK